MTRFTRDDRNDMARQYLAGARPSTIAKQFGTSVGYVIMLARQYAEANSIDINARVPKPKPERERKKRKSKYIQACGECRSAHAGRRPPRGLRLHEADVTGR